MPHGLEEGTVARPVPVLPFAAAAADPAGATLRAALGRRRTWLTVPLGGLDLRLRPGGGSDAAPRIGFGLAGGRGTMRIELPAGVAEALLLAGGADLGLTAEDPQLAALVLEAVLAPALERLEAMGGPRLSLTANTVEQGEPAAVLSFSVAAGGAAGTALLHLGPDDAAAAARLLARWPEEPADLSVLDDLPVPLTVGLGAVRLTAGELAALAPGDTVLWEQGPPAEAGPLPLTILAGGLWAIRARLDGTRVIISGPRLPARSADWGVWCMSDSVAAPAEDGGIDDLPVALRFELGRLDLPLGELRRLAEGAVLELGRDAAQPVDIVANGRRIGSGEIVRIGGELGVRVLRLFDR